jgi:metal-responsive CopG/Arc/MetJ family transcriptional regulator
MQITIEIDEKTIAQIDSVAKDSKKDRLQYINESLQKTLQKDLQKRKCSEEEVSKMYKEAYEKFPVQPDEFEIEDEQMEEFWKQI